MNINLITPINTLGYGITGLNIAKELGKKSEVSLFPIGQPQVTTFKDHDYVKAAMMNANRPDFNAPCIRIWHQNDMSQFVGNGPKIGFPIFELDRFTPQELHHLSYLDSIFVCSQWAKNIVLNNLNSDGNQYDADRVKIVPLGVAPQSFDVLHRGGATNFFTCGKWEIRKGHDVLIKAFNEAFNINDNVKLYMMCDNPFLSKEQEATWKNMYINSPLGSKVRFISRVETHEEVMGQMANMDCGIFISRAEGWNLELLEMMSIGKHVIATNYSGHTEFCNNENAYLVDVNDYEAAQDGIWFHGQGNWAQLGDSQIKQIVDHMRNVHELKQSDNLYINTAGLETAQVFSWDNTAEKVIQHVKEITKR